MTDVAVGKICCRNGNRREHSLVGSLNEEFFAESLNYSSGSVPSVKICAPALKYCRDVCRYWPAYCALSFSDLHMHQPKWQGCDQIHWQKKNWHISTEQCLIVLKVVGGKKQPKKEGLLAWKGKKNHRQCKDGCSFQLHRFEKCRKHGSAVNMHSF